MEKPEKVSVLIAEDHMLFSEGVKIVLQSTPRFQDVRQARNGKEAIEMARQAAPDIVLMDIQMPEVNGIEAVHTIKKVHPSTKIIMLTSFTDSLTVRYALSAGADGYCSKEIDFKRLVTVMDMVLSGAIYLDPAIAHYVLTQYFGTPAAAPQSRPSQGAPVVPIRPQAQPTPVLAASDQQSAQAPATGSVQQLPPIRNTGDVLAPRELQVLKLLAENKNNEEIGEALQIGTDWVNAYIQNILGKLAVDNKYEAVVRAAKDGVVENSLLLESVG